MKNFYGFLTKKGKNIFLITLLSTALLFASCINDLFNDDKSSKKQQTQTEQTGSEELIPVKINIRNKKQIENILQNVKPQKNTSQARAASPWNVTLAYKILYKKVTETSPSSTVNQDNKEYMDVLTDSSAVLQLSKGNWDFTLIAYYNEKVVFTGDLLNQPIDSGNNTLNFTLEEIVGKGSIKITLVIPKSDDYTTTVQAQLKKYPSQDVIDTKTDLTLQDQEDGSNTASCVYSIGDVENGMYFAVFSITTKNSQAASESETAANSTETTTYPVPVRVLTNLTSDSIEKLTEIRNVCVITYDLGTDGTVSWTAAPERVYKKHQKVDLPTYKSLNPLQTKIFNGWKDQDGTDSESKTTMIIEQNVTLEPDWITTTLYVDGSSTGTAVKTLQDAVNKLVTYEALDGNDTSYQHEWTINVNGTCYGASDLSSLKITKLTITGDNYTQDILDGRTSATETATDSVITNKGTYPLFIENLTIQNGNNNSGGGLNITNTTAYLNKVVLINNTASENGGAIALTNSKLFIYGGTKIGPETATNAATDTAYSNKAALSGGGIYADENSTIYFGYTAADETDENNVTMTAETGTPSNIISYNYAGSTSGGTSGNSYGGGGIYCLGKLYTWGGTISYNSAAYGGGIYSTNLSMKGSTVSNNAATVEGGGIYKKDNTTKAFITSANLNGAISRTKISGNTSGNTSDNTSSYFGGGISFWGELYISDTIISGNKANGKYSQGGGIYVNSDTSSKLFLYGETTIGDDSASSFATESNKSNSAAAGGGIYLCTSASAFLNYSSENATAHTGTVNITYNYVQTDFGNKGGGGIFADSSSKLYIAPGTTINYNATNMNGGGIFGKGTTYMSGGTIYGNNASSWGGGIYLSGENYSYGTLYMYGEAKIGTSDNLIDGSYSNSAQYGGGICLADIYSQAYLGDEENNLSGGVSYNKALATIYGGGGIYNKGLLQVSSGSISNNISKNDGGGIYNETDAQFTMYGSSIASNTADGSGGGIYNSGTLGISAATIESNTAKNGGGVYNTGIFDVSSGNIKSNTVTENGGGIYTTSAASSEKTVLEKSEITKNEAGNGGGVYIAKGKLDIKGDTIFKENTATGKGGAISGAIGEENEYSCSINIQDQGTSAYAYIKPDPDCNDVYLGPNSYINLENTTLSPTNHYFARITPPIKSGGTTYNDEPVYLTGDANNVSTEYKKFLVTPQSVNNTQVLWETTSEGKIKESNTTFVKIPAAEITCPLTDSESNVVSGVFVTGRPTLKLKSFYICDHEVTQGEYEKYCFYGVTINWDTWTQNETTKVKKDNNYPACFVSWYDAIVYCNLRSIAEGLEPVYSFGDVTDPASWGNKIVPETTEEDREIRYRGPSPEDTEDPWSEIKQDLDKSGWRLPLEAEWEYAARGGKGSDGKMETYLYSGSDSSEVVAWMGSNAKIGNDYYPHEVKKLAANRLGLYDMSGNVVELCWDWYSDDLSTAPITGPESNTNLKVAAPGGAYQWPRTLKAYKAEEAPLGRSSNPKNARFCNAGFRIVRTITEQEQGQ